MHSVALGAELFLGVQVLLRLSSSFCCSCCDGLGKLVSQLQQKRKKEEAVIGPQVLHPCNMFNNSHAEGIELLSTATY